MQIMGRKPEFWSRLISHFVDVKHMRLARLWRGKGGTKIFFSYAGWLPPAVLHTSVM